MYCPACDKEFSPVHSRCPECKGWLRVSGPTGGAKPASAAPSVRPVSTAPAAAAASAPSAPSMRPAASVGPSVENLPTQKASPVTGANVPLPSRPSAKLPTPSAPPVAAPRPAAPAPASQAGANDWAEQSESPSPVAGPANGSRAPEPIEGRGGLGTGWEASGSFQAPQTGWGSPGGATTGWAGPGAVGPTGVLGAVSSAPAATGWGAPASAPPSFAGLGGPVAGPPSGSLGAPQMGGFGTPPASSLGNGPAASMGTPVSGGLNGGGGWLGDGGGGGSSFPSSVTPKATGGWLGDAQTPAPAHAEASPVSMPGMAAPEVGSASDAPLLALPDHTVAVDLGTPWEDEGATAASNSNKMVYAVLTTVVLGLAGFFGYTHYQNQALRKPSSPTSSASPVSSALNLGEASLKKGKAAFKNKKWAEAVGHADMAQMLIKDLKTAPKERVKDVVKFHRDANLRYASVSFDQANRALQAGDTNKALGLAEQTVSIYRKLSGTSKDQARAYAFEGKVYERIGDLVNAQSAYKRAAGLNPNAGYQQQVSAMRQSQMPEVVQYAPAEPGQPAPQAQPAQPAFVQPSLGDGPSVPTGSSGGGGYRPSGGGAAAAPQAAPAAPVRRQNTYVPPKRDTTPSFMKKRDDRLPGY